MDISSGKRSDLLKLLYDNKYFIVPYIVFTACILVLMGIYSNASLFLYINRCHSNFADILFLNFTNLGDGVVAFVLVVVLLWVSFRESLTFLLITVLITIVVNILKDHIFPELNRPVAYFGTSEILHLVPGYDPPMLSTFPSGHTATAFSAYLYLSILSRRLITKFSLFLVAFFVGYSRIYLSAHFPADVVAGASIAVLITILCYYLSRRINNSWIDKKLVFRPKIFVRQQTI